MTFKEVCDLIACDEHKNLELKKTTGELKDGISYVIGSLRSIILP